MGNLTHLRVIFKLKSMLKFSKATVIQSTIVGALFVFVCTMLFFFTFGIDQCINSSASNDNRTLQVKVISPTTLDRSLVLDDISELPQVEDAYYIEDGSNQGESINILMKNYAFRFQVLNDIPNYIEKLSFVTHNIEGDLPKIQFVKQYGSLVFLLIFIVLALFQVHIIRRIIRENKNALTLAYGTGFNKNQLLVFFIKPLIHLGLITATLVTVVQAISFWLITNPILSSIDLFITYEIVMKPNLAVTLMGAIVLIFYVFIVLSVHCKVKSLDNLLTPMVTDSL